MKLVNPSVLNIERIFRYSELVNDCSDFIDKYTHSNPEFNGCYGCEHISPVKSNECDKKHNIKFGFIRKDENNRFVKSCMSFKNKNDYYKSTYVSGGCAQCVHLRSRTLGGCDLGYINKEEQYRIG
jgi:hypothetical protein